MTDETTAPEKTTDEASKENEAETSAKEVVPKKEETRKENSNPSSVAEKTEAKQEKKPNDRGERRERRPRRGGRDRRGQKEPKEFEEAILQIDRVTRVVKGGRRLRFRITVVIGDKKGRVGLGIGKSTEIMGGIKKAIAIAKKNLFKVPIVDGTIPHPANSKFKSSRVLLFPAPEGKGVIAGGAVRKILELAGLRDVLSKSHGSRNRLNVALATFQALGSMATKKNPRIKQKKSSTEETATEEKPKDLEEEKETPKKDTDSKPAPAKKKDSAKKAPSKSADKQ